MKLGKLHFPLKQLTECWKFIHLQLNYALVVILIIKIEAAKYERKMRKLFAYSARIVQNLQEENGTLRKLIDGLEQEKVCQNSQRITIADLNGAITQCEFKGTTKRKHR